MTSTTRSVKVRKVSTGKKTIKVSAMLPRSYTAAQRVKLRAFEREIMRIQVSKKGQIVKCK